MNLDNTNMKEVGIIGLIDQLSVIDRPKRSISHRPLYLSRLRKFQYSLPLPESLCQWRSPLRLSSYWPRQTCTPNKH